jgi:hypothetical protein
MGQQMARSFGQQDAPAAAQSTSAPQAAPQPAPAGPPPLPAQAQWFVGVDGRQQGPFDAEGLAAQARAGSLTGSTLVWRNGMPAWSPAGEVAELASVLGSVPPPLPPS